MKLRVRLAGAPDAPLLRADDVQPTQSIEQLSARCRAHFADWLSSSPSSSSPPSRPLLTFSLNKKDALLPDGDGTAPVSALGVTSGDLLWIIDACVAREAAAAVAPVAAATATTGGGVGRGARSMQPAPAAAAAPNEQLAADDEAGAEENEEEEHHHHHQAPAEPLLPAHLRRALSALGPAAATPVALLAAAVHAAMLEAGFEAVGADAAEEQQKQQQQQEQQNPPNRRRRRYRHGAGAGDVSYPPVSGAGGEQLSAARAAEGVRVEVRCAPLGGASVLVAGSVTSSSAAAAAAAGGAAASSAPAAPPPTTAVVTLTLSVAEHVRDDEDEGKGEGEPMETEDGGPLPQNNYNRHSRRLVAAPALWRRLKDGLCSPLLAAHHRAAGLPPPAGLLALPLDLLVREVLPRVVASSGGNEEAAADGSHETDGPPAAAAANAAARSLASCCLACSALRAAASDDALWRPVFEAEANAIGGAGDPSVPLLRANAERRGWRWAAAALVAERRRRARLARLRQRRALALPWPGGMIGGPRAPFFPAPPGFRGAPGIIGGDYDRLPGGGGGRGGGGFGGGGSGFGGSGGGGFFFAAQGGGGAAGSAMPGPAPGPFGMPGAGGSRRGGGGGGGRDFALRH